jgi:hypothetical protein
LKVFQYFLPRSRRKIDNIPTNREMIHRIINAAIQTIALL